MSKFSTAPLEQEQGKVLGRWPARLGRTRLGMTLDPLLGSTAQCRAEVCWNRSLSARQSGVRTLPHPRAQTTHISRVSRRFHKAKNLSRKVVPASPLAWYVSSDLGNKNLPHNGRKLVELSPIRPSRRPRQAEFKNKYFADLSSGSEKGSNFKPIDVFVTPL